MFCTDVNPSFGFGPNAIRTCKEDATWSEVDTLHCTVRPTQSVIVVYSTFVVVDNINSTNISSPEIEEVRL